MFATHSTRAHKERLQKILHGDLASGGLAQRFVCSGAMIKTPVKPAPNSLMGMVTRSVTPRHVVFIALSLAALFLLYSKSPLRNVRISICLRRSAGVRQVGELAASGNAESTARTLLVREKRPVRGARRCVEGQGALAPRD